MPDAPITLTFDTSAAHCAAVLLSGTEILGFHFEERARGQAEELFPILNKLMAEAGIAYADLSAIGVGTGPGNFTGLRISIAAARGLALGLDIPAIGVSSFDVAHAHFSGARPTVLLPATRGMAFKAVFEDGTRKSDPTLVTPEASDELTPIDWQNWGMHTLARLCAEAYASQNEVERLSRSMCAPPTRHLPGTCRRPCCHEPGSSRRHPRSCLCPQRGWSAQEITSLLDTPGTRLFSEPGGFALIRTVADEAELLTIAVAPNQQGQGTGRALMDKWMRAEKASAAFLEVAADNRPALALYASLGFCEIARRSAYYARPDAQAVDALIMRVELTPGQHLQSSATPLKTG